MGFAFYVDVSKLNPSDIDKYYILLRDSNFGANLVFDNPRKIKGIVVATSKTFAEFTASPSFPKGCECWPYYK